MKATLIKVVISLLVIAVVLGTFLPTIADDLADIYIEKSLALTSSDIEADIYVNDTANTTEFQMRWDISDMTGKNENGLNITSATLRLCNTSAVDSQLNVTRIVNQTWTEGETTTSYKALTIGISQNLSFTTTSGCINVEIFGIINPDRNNDYTSFKISGNNSKVVRANVYWVFNTTNLYMNDTSAAQVRFNSGEATTNNPTLTINYRYPISASTQSVLDLVQLVLVLGVLLGIVAIVGIKVYTKA